MKTFQKLSFLFIALGLILFLGSCESEQLEPAETQELNLDFSEKMKTFRKQNGNVQNQNSSKAAIAYLQELCGEDEIVGSATKNSISNLGNRDYYFFSGEAGDVVTIEVNRIDCEMDPYFVLYSGLYTDTNDLSNAVAAADDNDAPFCNSGCFAFSDPLLSEFTLPTTGSYTLAVADYISCNVAGPFAYSLIFTSDDVTCDADGDGCPDDVDPHPESNVEETVIIDGCDSGVANVFVSEDGCSTMSDLIADCADNASNHGDFVSCVSALTNSWKKSGIISGKEKGKIQSCAANAN